MEQTVPAPAYPDFREVGDPCPWDCLLLQGLNHVSLCGQAHSKLLQAAPLETETEHLRGVVMCLNRKGLSFVIKLL